MASGVSRGVAGSPETSTYLSTDRVYSGNGWQMRDFTTSVFYPMRYGIGRCWLLRERWFLQKAPFVPHMLIKLEGAVLQPGALHPGWSSCKAAVLSQNSHA